MSAATARYIGLRTWRYRPVTTRCSVGATGAGVPSPCEREPGEGGQERGQAGRDQQPADARRARADVAVALPSRQQVRDQPGDDARGDDEEDERPGDGARARARHLIRSGVPIGMIFASRAIRAFGTRTQPCDGRPGISSGWLVPWMPTTPPPGQSDSFPSRPTCRTPRARRRGCRRGCAAARGSRTSRRASACRARRRRSATSRSTLPPLRSVARSFVAVDGQVRRDDLEVRDLLLAHPAGAAVGPPRDADLQPDVAASSSRDSSTR